MKRPLGITLIAGLTTFIGGTMTLVIFIETIDALRFLGLYGISVDTPLAMLGFVFYGLMPVVFYTTGLGLFMSYRWAYRLAVSLLPGFSTVLIFHVLTNAMRQRYYYRIGFLKVLLLKPQIFLWVGLFYLCVVLPMVSYLKTPYVRLYFGEEGASS